MAIAFIAALVLFALAIYAIGARLVRKSPAIDRSPVRQSTINQPFGYSTNPKARTGNVPNRLTFTGTA